jgi:hypothetical protein
VLKRQAGFAGRPGAGTRTLLAHAASSNPIMSSTAVDEMARSRRTPIYDAHRRRVFDVSKTLMDADSYRAFLRAHAE